MLSKLDLMQLFSKVEVRGHVHCWPWLGNLNKDGYGKITLEGKSVFPHREILIFYTGE